MTIAFLRPRVAPVGLFSALVMGACVLLAASASAQLRVVTWNTLDGPDNAAEDVDFRTVLEAIGAYSVNGIATPVDVLALQETDSASIVRVRNILNDLYPEANYRSFVSDENFDPVGILYNDATLDRVGSVIQVAGDPRDALRIQLLPAGYAGSENLLTFYSFHLKAGGSASDFERRGDTAFNYRTNADILGQGQHVVFLGDYNIRSSTEEGFTRFTEAGNAQAFDPVDRPGTYKNNSAFADVHTHSTSDVDDRFDLQLVTGELLDGEGLSYIGPTAPGTAGTHSYWAFGNDGAIYNDPITDSSALPSNVLSALQGASDHLPVIADYQLPALMQIDATPAATQAFVGEATFFLGAVQNIAPVSVAAGADELDYSATASGDVAAAGTFVDTADPLAAANAHVFAFDTTTAGQKTASFDVTSLSDGVADQQTDVSIDVFDHANGSFDSGSDLNSLTIDFGSVVQGTNSGGTFGGFSELVDIFNLEGTAGFTSALSISDPTAASGDTDVLGLTLPPSSDEIVDPGESSTQIATFSTMDVGTFAATWEIVVGDALDIAGALSETLTLNLVGEVIAAGFIDGDYNGDGFVSQADLDLVLLNWGDSALPAGWAAVDQFDGVQISQNELDGVLLNWGSGTPPVAAIPEPASLVLWALAGFGLTRGRREGSAR